jgi:hypothetical protein
MMAGYRQILEIRRLETRIAELGFMFCHSRSHGMEDGDTVALKPKDADSLPIYSRDAEVFVGSLTDLQYWLRGLEWARDYDRIMKVSDVKKRARKEQDLRNRQLAKTLKEYSPGEDGDDL